MNVGKERRVSSPVFVNRFLDDLPIKLAITSVWTCFYAQLYVKYSQQALLTTFCTVSFLVLPPSLPHPLSASAIDPAFPRSYPMNEGGLFRISIVTVPPAFHLARNVFSSPLQTTTSKGTLWPSY